MKDKTRLFIGGSASTGSSLLAYMLGQHTKIYCGAETNLFTQSEWITNWNNVRKSLDRNSLKSTMSTGWHVHKGVQIDHLFSDDQDIEFLKYNDYQYFIHSIFSYVLNDEKVKLVAEKTPSNAPNFHLLQQIYPDAHFILTVRNPMDSIYSMRRRGWSLIYSCGLYLFNISLGYMDHGRFKVIKYEELIRDLETILSPILENYGLEFQEQMTQNLDKMSTIPSWQMDKANHGDENIGAEKKAIENLIDHLYFKEDFEFYGKKPKFKNIRAIMNELDYFRLDNKKKSFVRTQSLLMLEVEKLKRRLRNYPLSSHNFPFEIR